jgi:hypothetical protein
MSIGAPPCGKRAAQMMAWIAFDRAVKLVERLGLQLRSTRMAA